LQGNVGTGFDDAKNECYKTNDRINVCFYDHFKISASIFFEQRVLKQRARESCAGQGFAPHPAEGAVPERLSSHPRQTPDIVRRPCYQPQNATA
jgi:hypothetical protein